MTENLSVEPEVKQVEPKVVAELSSKFVTNINVALYHTEVDIACNFYKQNGKYYDPDGPWLDDQGGVTSLAKKRIDSFTEPLLMTIRYFDDSLVRTDKMSKD